MIFPVFGGYISDNLFKSYYNFVIYSMGFSMILTIICYTLISLSENIIFISFIQIILSLTAFGQISIIIYNILWIPDTRIRSTLTGLSYNLGCAIFVSTLLDIETYLADLDVTFGGLYAGLYVLFLCILSYIAIIYANNYHEWKDYYMYKIIDSNHDSDDEIITNPMM